MEIRSQEEEKEMDRSGAEMKRMTKKDKTLTRDQSNDEVLGRIWARSGFSRVKKGPKIQGHTVTRNPSNFK